MRVKAQESGNSNGKDQLLELTIYAVLDEFDVSQDSGTSSPLPQGPFGDEGISLLSEEVQSSLGESGRKEEEEGKVETESERQNEDVLDKEFLPIPENPEDSHDLLQDLKQLRLKEEAWAKRKARKEQRKKKVHFHLEGESGESKFIRSCCLTPKLANKAEPKGRFWDNCGESETSSVSGESSGSVESEGRGRRERRIAPLHSVNFSDRIIPKDRVTFTRESPDFQFRYSGASIRQLLARM